MIYGEFAERWEGKMHYRSAILGTLFGYMDDFKHAPCLIKRLQEIRLQDGSVKIDRAALDHILTFAAEPPAEEDIGYIAHFEDNRDDGHRSPTYESIDMPNSSPTPVLSAFADPEDPHPSNPVSSPSDQEPPPLATPPPGPPSLPPVIHAGPVNRPRRRRRLTFKAEEARNSKRIKLPPKCLPPNCYTGDEDLVAEESSDDSVRD